MSMSMSFITGKYDEYKKKKEEEREKKEEERKKKEEERYFENILKILKPKEVISDRSNIIEQIDNNIKIFQAGINKTNVGNAKNLQSKLRNFNNSPICSGFESDKKRLCDKITVLLEKKGEFEGKHAETLKLREEIQEVAKGSGVSLGYKEGGRRKSRRRRRTKKRRGKTTKKRRGRKSTKKKRKRKRKRTRRK